MPSPDKLVLFRDTMRELGIPDCMVDPTSATAVQNAIDMGKQTPHGAAAMARVFLNLPEA